MKKALAPVVFVSATTALMIAAASSIIVVPMSSTPPFAGVDVAISAASSGSGGSRDILVYNPRPSAGTTSSFAAGPPGFVSISIGTTSCNVQPFDQPSLGGPATYDHDLNAGTPNIANNLLDADWYAQWDTVNPQPAPRASGDRHPYIASNAYRVLPNGRMEQLSAAWVKHGWLAASSQQVIVGDPVNGTGQYGCGGVNNTGRTAANGNPCSGVSGNQLGANCADTYGSSLNDDRFYLGPRNEIKAHGTVANPGYYQIGGYHDNMVTSNTDATFHPETPAAVANQGDNVRSLNTSLANTSIAQMNKMNMISLAELDESKASIGAKFILEGYYVINGDANKLNNIAHRWYNYTPPTSGLPALSGTQFTITSPHLYGPALFRWQGADIQAAAPTDLGQAFVGSRVVWDADANAYRYEYNVFNLDIDQGFWSVSIPKLLSTNPTGISFRQPRQYAPAFPSANPNSIGGFIWGYDTADWTATDNGTELLFAPPATATPNTFKNALRWGTMYTFWFHSTQPPRTNGIITIARSDNGAIPPVTATIAVPRSLADITDLGGEGGPDGQLTVDDLINFVNAFSDGGGCPGTAPCNAADVTGLGGPPALPDGDLTVDDLIAFVNAYSEG